MKVKAVEISCNRGAPWDSLRRSAIVNGRDEHRIRAEAKRTPDDETSITRSRQQSFPNFVNIRFQL